MPFRWISWRHFSFLVQRAFMFTCVIKFLVTRDLPHPQKLLLHSEVDFSLLFEKLRQASVCHSVWRVFESSQKKQQHVIRILNQNITSQNLNRIFFFLFQYIFETADLRSDCGYFLAICQLWLVGFLLSAINMIHKFSKGAYLQLIELIDGQLMPSSNMTWFVVI